MRLNSETYPRYEVMVRAEQGEICIKAGDDTSDGLRLCEGAAKDAYDWSGYETVIYRVVRSKDQRNSTIKRQIVGSWS